MARRAGIQNNIAQVPMYQPEAGQWPYEKTTKHKKHKAYPCFYSDIYDVNYTYIYNVYIYKFVCK